MSHDRPQKITLAEMRAANVRGLLIYCVDYQCSHYIGISPDQWPDETRLSDLADRFICTACGRHGDRCPMPDFNWNRIAVRQMGCQ